jgi:2-dehydropantoate 2-reductase
MSRTHDSRDHYIILGAGAVGGTLGALLARSGRRVTLVGRAALAEAVTRQGGLIHIVAGVPHLVPLEAVSQVERVSLSGPATLFITTKAGDLEGALEAARRVLPRETLTVTWQNGLRAEDTALPVFPNLLGGIVRATSTMLVPGEVRIRTPGILIVGRYPVPESGARDEELDRVVTHLLEAGFDAAASPDIRADKGLKLLLNLISGASPLVAKDGRPAPELTRVERAVLIEGARILNRAGVRAFAASGKGDDVATMLRHLAERAPRPAANDSVHNSTWQNLALPGRRLENDFMNGEIVELARRMGTTAPWNARLLDLLREVKERQGGPDSLTDEELGRRFADLKAPAEWTPEDEERSRPH